MKIEKLSYSVVNDVYRIIELDRELENLLWKTLRNPIILRMRHNILNNEFGIQKNFPEYWEL